MNYLTEFNIQQLRTKNLTAAVESVAVIMGAVVANMLAPQLLLKYVYDASTLTEAPPIFEMLPLITYSLALVYFAYAMVGNFLRGRKVRVLEQELVLTGGNCCVDGNCVCHDDSEISDSELRELEKIVDDALKPESGKSSAKKTTKSSSKKTSKRTSKKK